MRITRNAEQNQRKKERKPSKSQEVHRFDFLLTSASNDP